MTSRRIAALLTGTALAGSLLVAVPGTAYAATTLTPTQVVEQLDAVGAATLAAAASGFTETVVAHPGAFTSTTRFDPVARMRLLQLTDFGGTTLHHLSTPAAEYDVLPVDAATATAIAYAGKPKATWVYHLQADNPGYNHVLTISFLLDGLVDGAPAPGQPTNVVLTGSTTTDLDGTRHWDVTTRDSSVAPAWLRAFSVTADPQDRVTDVSVVEGPEGDSTHYSSTESVVYARPVLTMPTAAQVISSTTLALARDSVHLRNRIGRIVLDTAAGANAYAAARHRVVIPRDIQGFARRTVQMAQRFTALIRVSSTSTGAVVWARNPFTRELVTYRVSVRHGKAVVTRVT